MTREEIHSFCYKWMTKAFEAGLKQSPTDAENSEFYLPMIDLSWSKQMTEKIESHAKERAVAFIQYHYEESGAILTDKFTNELYDTYIKEL